MKVTFETNANWKNIAKRLVPGAAGGAFSGAVSGATVGTLKGALTGEDGHKAESAGKGLTSGASRGAIVGGLLGGLAGHAIPNRMFSGKRDMRTYIRRNKNGGDYSIPNLKNKIRTEAAALRGISGGAVGVPTGFLAGLTANTKPQEKNAFVEGFEKAAGVMAVAKEFAKKPAFGEIAKKGKDAVSAVANKANEIAKDATKGADAVQKQVTKGGPELGNYWGTKVQPFKQFHS